MVTAEAAVVLPLLVLVAVAAGSVGQVVAAQIRCTDAAAVAARLTARGEPGPAVAAAVAQTAPGATLRLSEVTPVVTAEVTTAVRVAGLPLLPGLVLHARVSMPDEAGAARVGPRG